MPAWEEPPLTDRQRRRIHAQLGEAGVRERAARLAALSRIVGRPVASTNDLTMVEADRVTDSLITHGVPA